MNNVHINRGLPPSPPSQAPLIRHGDHDWSKRDALLDQADEAFAKAPTQNGVVQGRRKIHLGKRWFRCSYFPSRKNAAGHLVSIMIPVESRLELAYALQLERDPNVQAYRCQALKIELPEQKKYYPDFLILDQHGFLHAREVKVDKRHLNEMTKERFDYASKLLGRWGISYSVIDESEIPTGIKLENQMWLYAEIQKTPTTAEIEAFRHDILENLATHESSYGTLQGRCIELAIPTTLVPYMLFTGELSTHWHKLINGASQVWK